MSDLNPSSHKFRLLAKQVWIYEVAQSGTSGTDLRTLTLVSKALRTNFVTETGIAAFRSLVSRALVLAKGKAPLLAGVHLEADGSLAVQLPGNFVTEDEIAEGGITFIAEFFGLLVTFIGEKLTLTLVCRAWPNLPAMSTASTEKENDDAAR